MTQQRCIIFMRVFFQWFSLKLLHEEKHG
jgi:hypothetical protein